MRLGLLCLCYPETAALVAVWRKGKWRTDARTLRASWPGAVRVELRACQRQLRRGPIPFFLAVPGTVAPWERVALAHTVRAHGPWPVECEAIE